MSSAFWRIRTSLAGLWWAQIIHMAVSNERRNDFALCAAVREHGFYLFPQGPDEPTPKRTRTNVSADTGKKRTRSGSPPP